MCSETWPSATEGSSSQTNLDTSPLLQLWASPGPLTFDAMNKLCKDNALFYDLDKIKEVGVVCKVHLRIGATSKHQYITDPSLLTFQGHVRAQAK
jgi:hypothetical protein